MSPHCLKQCHIHLHSVFHPDTSKAAFSFPECKTDNKNTNRSDLDLNMKIYHSIKKCAKSKCLIFKCCPYLFIRGYALELFK